MSKLSKRLESLALLVDKKDSIVDVGCDHGLLSIYLVENKLCKKVIASDVNQNALNSAIKNISLRKLDIETVLSDGIEQVNLKGINTLIISGMGTSTILHILSDDNKLKKINKLILQSNNDHELLRSELNRKGYFLEKEVVLKDKGKWYVTMLFVKSNEVNTKKVIKYGYLNNEEYNTYLVDYYKKIYKKIPFISIKAKYKALVNYINLKRVTKK